jgi:molecular chaperone HscB
MRKADVAVESRSMFESTQKLEERNARNPFDMLGIAPTFEIDLNALDAAYFSRQSLTHPDRFVYHSDPERQAASSQAALLNWAYERIKDPVMRAKELLILRGVQVPGEEGQPIQDKEVLMEMMGLQESLSEAESPQDLKTIETQIQDRFKLATASFAAALSGNESEKWLGLFLRMTYLSKMMEDIKNRRRQLSIKAL